MIFFSTKVKTKPSSLIFYAFINQKWFDLKKSIKMYFTNQDVLDTIYLKIYAFLIVYDRNGKNWFRPNPEYSAIFTEYSAE